MFQVYEMEGRFDVGNWYVLLDLVDRLMPLMYLGSRILDRSLNECGGYVNEDAKAAS